MPPLKTYDLFLSHVWRLEYNSEYYRLANILDSALNFKWRNYSVPEHDPLGINTNQQLQQALDIRIRSVNCFLVVSDMYVNYRQWIQEEINIALRYRKPIVGIIPWGQQRVPVEVQRIANEMVSLRIPTYLTAD